MGNSEYDRIRNKNKFENEAFDLYQDLKSIGFSNGEIIKYANFAMQNGSDFSRNEIYSKMILIVRSINENEGIKY